MLEDFVKIHIRPMTGALARKLFPAVAKYRAINTLSSVTWGGGLSEVRMRLKVGPCQSGMEIHAYNSSIQEGETGGLPKVQGHFGLHSELKASLHKCDKLSCKTKRPVSTSVSINCASPWCWTFSTPVCLED